MHPLWKSFQTGFVINLISRVFMRKKQTEMNTDQTFNPCDNVFLKIDNKNMMEYHEGNEKKQKT